MNDEIQAALILMSMNSRMHVDRTQESTLDQSTSPSSTGYSSANQWTDLDPTAKLSTGHLMKSADDRSNSNDYTAYVPESFSELLNNQPSELEINFSSSICSPDYKEKSIDLDAKQRQLKPFNELKKWLFNCEDGNHDLLNDDRVDEDFERFYSIKNLYQIDDQTEPDKKYRIFVKRHGDEIRVYKPKYVIRKSGSLICSTYCFNQNNAKNSIDSNDLSLNGIIWPFSSNRHEENVQTIRKLIQAHPIPDKLPYADEVFNPKSFQTIGTLNNEPSNCDNNQEKKKKVRQSSKHLDCVTKRSEPVKSKKKVNKLINHSKNKSKPSHCPYCYRLFSEPFNAKLHYHGRLKFKDGSRHISCSVSSKLNGEIDREPILCTDDCKICYY